jgi:hypothetical protein
MLTIDRTHTQMDILSGPSAEPSTGVPGPGRAPDIREEERFRERVLEVLRGAIRDLERRGHL